MRGAILRSLPIGLFLIVAYSMFVQTPDDAFITYRYAANLVAGHGAVFNVGDRVEGYSSPLHMLLSAALIFGLSTSDVLLPAKILGLLFGVGTLLMMAPIGRRLELRPRDVMLAQLLVVLNPSFAISASNGLETSLYGFLISVTAWLFLREMETKQGTLSGWMAFALLFTRPDATLICAALFGLRALEARRSGTLRTRFIVLWAAAFVLPTIALIAARLLYYGELLPNTYYAKDTALSFGIPQGIRYLTKALAPRVNHIFAGETLATKLVLVASVPVYWGTLMWGAWKARRQRPMWICSALTAATAVFVMKAGGDWMQGWRFCVPVLPLMALLQCYAVRNIGDGFAASATAARGALATLVRTAPVVLLGFWLVVLNVAPRMPWHSIGFATSGRDFLAASVDAQVNGLMQVQIGEWMAQHLPRGSSVAYSEVGYAGITNMDKRFVDLFGLVTKQVARAVPRQKKVQLGSLDKSWFTDASPVGKVLLQLRPKYIIYPGPYAASVLGHYHLREVLPRSLTRIEPICVYEFMEDADLKSTGPSTPRPRRSSLTSTRPPGARRMPYDTDRPRTFGR